MSSQAPMHSMGLWLSSPLAALVELAADAGFGRLVLDLEHGEFDQAELNLLIPLARALGLRVFAKVAGPDAVWIQQALDFGADGVIVPHVLDSGHARQVCAAAKYPPLGNRSFAGGRIVRYGAMPASFAAEENRRVQCLPMIESVEALADVDEILGLPMVDGLFLGPTDLALSRGRPAYTFGDADRNDLEWVAKAAKAAGKPWVLPAWTAAERQWAQQMGAQWTVVLDEHGILCAGMGSSVSELCDVKSKTR
jgi:4-hydroxy-2-oxoheptanedioate aldolase